MSKVDLWQDATAQAALVRSGEVSASDLLEQTIAHAEAVNPRVNSLIIPLFEKARRESAGAPAAPFTGVPYVLKDLTIVSEGDLNTSSIKGVKAAGYKADHDSYFVRRMRRAGFVLLGRVNTPEMGTQATTEPQAWGACRNPWNLDRSVGGSSGGSGAAVAAAIAPVAHGNDAGGSVRAPASLCGVVGIKGTRGRISSGPMVTDSDNVSGLAHEGLMARSVRDIAALLDVVGGHHAGDSFSAPYPRRPFIEEVGADPGNLKVGVLTRDAAGDFTVEAEIVAVVRKAADTLANLGHKVSDDHPEALGDRSFLGAFMPLADVAISREIDRYSALIGRELGEDDVEWTTWEMVRRAAALDGRSYAACVDQLREYAGRVERWWEEDGWDLLVTPTVGRQTARIGELMPTKATPFVEGSLPVLAFTCAFNVSGQPAISLPLGMTADGMPIGVQLVAAFGREDLLLRVAAQLEAAMPWIQRRPALAGARQAQHA